ncbi:MAG TPA: hypothetical protein P5528_11310 [Steroidobacteraceae bacterium]|nr:hypothetical protein [Steroidobacteraceae bacterium]
MPVSNQPNESTPVGPGTHPYDATLADSRLLAWMGSIVDLARRQWQVLLLGAIAIAVVQWLVPHLAVSSPIIELRIWPRLIDFLLPLTLNSFVFAVSYSALARREGSAYGLGHVEPWSTLPLRGLLLAVIWAALGLAVLLIAMLFAYITFKAFGPSALASAGGLGALLRLGMYAVFVVPLVLLLFAPLWVGLALRYNLSFVRIVRTDEGAWTAFRVAWQRVSSESWRYFSHAYVLMLLVAAFAAATLWLFRYMPALVTAGLTILLSMVALMLSVATAFIIERVYDTSLGLELGAEPASTFAAGVPAAARSASQGNQSSTAPAAQEPLVASEFARLIGAQSRDPREVRTLLGRCQDKAAALEAVRPQFLSLAQSPRIAEAIVLAEAALTSDPRFFATDPDITMPLAKRLAAGGRGDLAVRVLQPFVREQQKHKLHLTGALYAAHLVAQTLNKPDAARQFLGNLKKLYPDEPLIDQQLKRLPG